MGRRIVVMTSSWKQKKGKRKFERNTKWSKTTGECVYEVGVQCTHSYLLSSQYINSINFLSKKKHFNLCYTCSCVCVCVNVCSKEANWHAIRIDWFGNFCFIFFFIILCMWVCVCMCDFFLLSSLLNIY